MPSHQINETQIIPQAKQITDLMPADSFDEGDLLLVRKTGLGVDKNINYANFVRSIGNSFVSGYVASRDEEEENKIILTHASGMPLNRYYDGMKISFVSPIDSSDTVYIAIGELGYIKLSDYGSEDTLEIKHGDYIEAFYSEGEEDQGVFYRTNNLKLVQTSTTYEQPLQVPANPDFPIQTSASLAPSIFNIVPPIEVIPNIHVGQNEAVKSIGAAIKQLISEHGEIGNFKRCTITLATGFIWDESVDIQNQKLSWITILSPDETVIKSRFGHYALRVREATVPNLTGKFKTNDGQSVFQLDRNSKAMIKDLVFTGRSLFDLSEHSSIGIYSSSLSNMERIGGQREGCSITMDNCTADSAFLFSSSKSKVQIDNCKFTAGSNRCDTAIESTEDVSFKMTNTTIDGKRCGIRFNYTRDATLTNCTVRATAEANKVCNSVAVVGTSQVLIDGGDYRFKGDNSDHKQNIHVDKGTLRLVNSPLGGTSASNNGNISRR